MTGLDLASSQSVFSSAYIRGHAEAVPMDDVVDIGLIADLESDWAAFR